jgi:hypothetical protein
MGTSANATDRVARTQRRAVWVANFGDGTVGVLPEG